MTREQRETIAKAVGSLWGIAAVETNNEVSNALNETGYSLDKILMDDIRATEIESFLKSPAHIVCNDSCTFDDGSKVSET